MNKQPEKLWDPKYAAIGVLTIAAAVFVLDYLPGMLVARFRKAIEPAPLPEPQSLKARSYDEFTQWAETL